MTVDLAVIGKVEGGYLVPLRNHLRVAFGTSGFDMLFKGVKIAYGRRIWNRRKQHQLMQHVLIAHGMMSHLRHHTYEWLLAMRYCPGHLFMSIFISGTLQDVTGHFQ